MRIRLAAGFTAVIVLACIAMTVFALAPGLRLDGVFSSRQVWLVVNGGLWATGLWLWLLGIFSWMVLLVALLWSYSPAHRITTMLQSGLIILAAGLAIGGTVIWMNVLPYTVELEDAHLLTPLVDALALGLIGAGCFMGGAVTAWIGIDLTRLGVMPWYWLTAYILAGLSALPAPFLLPHQPWFLAIGAVVWTLGSVHLAVQWKIPNAYAEWP